MFIYISTNTNTNTNTLALALEGHRFQRLNKPLIDTQVSPPHFQHIVRLLKPFVMFFHNVIQNNRTRPRPSRRTMDQRLFPRLQHSIYPFRIGNYIH